MILSHRHTFLYLWSRRLSSWHWSYGSVLSLCRSKTNCVSDTAGYPIH